MENAVDDDSRYTLLSLANKSLEERERVLQRKNEPRISPNVRANDDNGKHDDDDFRYDEPMEALMFTLNFIDQCL